MMEGPLLYHEKQAISHVNHCTLYARVLMAAGPFLFRGVSSPWASLPTCGLTARRRLLCAACMRSTRCCRGPTSLQST